LAFSCDTCINLGGWDTKAGGCNTDISAQIDQAFVNVDVALKDAGGKGWDQVGLLARLGTALTSGRVEVRYMLIVGTLLFPFLLQVFRVNSYHVPLNNEALDAMVRNLGKWMPNHKPIWTCSGVPRLGEDDMKVEIEAVAHDPK
jgi:enamine deaminase RidA (YjgF/YER057c/UK114 family)